MIDSNQLKQILDRIVNGEETKEDINILRQLLRAGDSQNLVQLGKYNVNIGESKGNIHIGDRIYQGADADSIKEGLREVLQQQKSNRPRKEQLLLTEVRREVKARLKKSLPLNNTVLINLGKELQPDRVDCPYDGDILIGAKSNELLSNKTSILEVFEQDEIQGKLLILGKPGSGKTTAVLELTQNLISIAWENPSESMPVLVNLSSWKQVRQPISEWIVPQLAKKYPVSHKDCLQWLREQKLLPILDGLDELESSLQQPCIEAINVFLNEEKPPMHMVVCSRNEEYVSNKIRLKLNGAICLQPLTDEQIQNYLTQIQHIPLWQTIRQDDKLLELVRTPLLLSITILVYQEISVEKWQKLKSKEERLKYLWDSYIYRMLMRETNHKHSNYKFSNIKQNRIWLIWLAKLLQLKDKVEFAVEELQPFETLDDNSQKIYRQILWLVTSLIIVLILYLRTGFFHQLSQGIIISSSVIAIVILIIYRFSNRIIIIDKLYFELPEIISSSIITIYAFVLPKFTYTPIIIINTPIIIIILLTISFFGRLQWNWMFLLSLFTFIPVLFFISVSWLLGNTGNILFTGLLCGVLFGRIVQNVLMLENKNLDIETEISQNRSIYKSIKNAILIGIISGLIVGIISGLNRGLIFGLIFCLISGGIACIQHYTLRFVLYYNGSIPLNYVQFLEYATTSRLLQRISGRYRFIHTLLQEHFAAMSLEK